MPERLKDSGFCDEHGKNCKALEYLEKEQDRLKSDLYNKTVELKDARGSMKHDFERFEDQIRRNFATKSEFESVKKLINWVVGLMLAYAFKTIVS